MRKSLTALKGNLEQQNRQILGMYESFATGGISKADYPTTKAAAVQRRDSIAARIAELEAALENLGADGKLQNSFLERELTEAKTQLSWPKKRTERIQQRYDALDRQCVALNNNVGSLRSGRCAAEQQIDGCKRALQAFCRPAQTAEDLKRVYEMVSPFLDDGGIELFYAAQEITGF